MNTSLITDVWSGASHAEESSESSNMRLSNSEIKLLNSLPESLAGVHSLFICLLSETFYDRFLLNYASFLWWICTLGRTWFGGSWTVLFIVFSLAVPTFGFFLLVWWLLHISFRWLVRPERRTRICWWNVLNFECWEWVPMWSFEVNGHISDIL